MIIEKITETIKEACEKLGFDSQNVVVSFSNMPTLCDFQSNYAFQIAKQAQMPPFKVAEAIINQIGDNPNFLFSVANGYINIKLKNETFSQIANQYLKDEKCGVEEHQNKMCVLIY